LNAALDRELLKFSLLLRFRDLLAIGLLAPLMQRRESAKARDVTFDMRTWRHIHPERLGLVYETVEVADIRFEQSDVGECE
jgi:hypothetical protein